jgi:hypothetical protein
MADTFSPYLRVRLPEVGQYSNSWGTVLNSDAITLLDHGITGAVQIALGVSTTHSLAALSDGSAADSRYFCLVFTGTPGSTVTVTVPGTVLKKQYLIDNDSGQDMLIKYTASTGVTVPDGVKQLIWCDGSEVYKITADAVNATQLGGVAAANYARLDQAQNFLAGQGIDFEALTDGATIPVDASQSNYFRVVLGGDRTLANPSNPRDGQTIEVHVRQDGTGGRTLAYGSQWRWPDDIAPTLSTGPNRLDVIVATYRSDLTRWMASIVQNFNP